MRIPNRRLYRAFSALDRFTDPQCQMFLAAVRGSMGRRLRHVAGAFVVGAVLLLVVGGTILYFGSRYENQVARSRSWSAFYVGAAAAFVLTLGVPALGGFLTRDFLLRRALRRVINTRGSCPKCSYVLTSLPVPAHNRITCPECGYTLTADPALGEVVADAEGVNRYLPSPDLIAPTFRWLTKQRKRLLLKVAIIGPLVLAALLGLGWGGYEWFLARQAALAIAQRPRATWFEKRILEMQPSDTTTTSPDGWDAFFKADAALVAIDTPAWRAAFTTQAFKPYADFDAIRSPQRSTTPGEERMNRAGLRLALEMLDAYERNGVFAKLDEMAACRRAVRTVNWPGASQPMYYTALPELGRCRNFARIDAARMRLAAGACDRQGFVRAMEANLAMSRMLSRGPFLIDGLVGIAIEELTYGELQGALADGLPEAWLDDIERALDRQTGLLPIAELFENERQLSLEAVGWLFSEPSRVRWGRLSILLTQIGAGNRATNWRKRLGTYRGNVARFNDYYDRLIHAVRVEPFERQPIAPMPDEYILGQASYLGATLTSSLAPLDQITIQRRGVRVCIALERYRLGHGEYPRSLEEIAPLLKVADTDDPAIRDPFSGRAFGYRRLDGADGADPGYVLYSIGADGIDDGGAGPSVGDRSMTLIEGKARGDFVVNASRRR